MIRIPTSQAQCQQMLEFTDQWIQSGSDQNYGGGKDTEHGEGAGCADFAMEFFKIATESSPLSSWYARINIPQSLIGNPEKPVNFYDILLRDQWAVYEAHTAFKIPDTNLVWDWLAKEGLNCGSEYLWYQHVMPALSLHSLDCSSIERVVKEKVENLPVTTLQTFSYHSPLEQAPWKPWLNIWKR